jgi:hypothetical protein
VAYLTSINFDVLSESNSRIYVQDDDGSWATKGRFAQAVMLSEMPP